MRQYINKALVMAAVERIEYETNYKSDKYYGNNS